MKVIVTFICCCFTLCANAQRCGTTDYVKQHSLLLSPVKTSSNAVISGRDTLKNEVIVVPVVVHVLYHTSTQNISDEQVLSQIAVLNNDYRKLNSDIVNAPEPFKNIAGDTRIVFCLAKMDPNGRYSPGIIHKYTREELFLSDDAMKFSSSGGDDGWDSKKYLNIWVCNLFGRTLGYSVLPGGDADKDGVVIQFNAFGTIGTVATPFNEGRTTTHEVGHWLGLRHLWGDALCGDDGINDTPPQQTSNTDCPAFPHLSSCSTDSNGDMFMNYMDFTNDACMNMFTEGQKSVMRGMFALGNPRNSFLNLSVCDSSLAQGGPLPGDSTSNSADISVYPNPFSNQVTISYKNVADIAGKTIKIYDITGKLVFVQIIKSQKISVALNNLPNGMYFLKIESRNKPLVFKLIKQSGSR